ncbi:MAG TPA: hypothetical protein VIO58_15750 [Candidatus Methanoperedens sp.]
MNTWKKIVIIIGLLIAVQLPYIWFIFHSDQKIATYLKPDLQKSAEIDWFNPENFRLRWYAFDNLSEPTVIRSGDNLTLWIHVYHYNETEFNITEIKNVQLWFFNIWSPNASQFGEMWKLNIYLQGKFDRTQMLAIPNDNTGTQLILNWDDERVAKPGEMLRFDINFESIIPADATLEIKSIELLLIGKSK